MIKSVIWSSMIDYPNQVSTVLFVGACNWDCDYCHNKNLVNMKSIDFMSVILPKLLKRKHLIDHVLISGGESTCWTDLTGVIKILKTEGFKVGIHTNGSNYRVLREIIKDISFVGMDIKTSRFKYNSITNSNVNYYDIHKSMVLIKVSGIESEFRTTLFPKEVAMRDCIEIAKLLKSMGVERYVLQQFDDSNLKGCSIKPYSKGHIKQIQTQCNKYVNTFVRGI